MNFNHLGCGLFSDITKRWAWRCILWFYGPHHTTPRSHQPPTWKSCFPHFAMVLLNKLPSRSRVDMKPWKLHQLIHCWWSQIFLIFTPAWGWWSNLTYMCVSKNRGTPKWMVYNGKPYQNGWFGGTTILGNIHIYFSDWFETTQVIENLHPFFRHPGFHTSSVVECKALLIHCQQTFGQGWPSMRKDFSEAFVHLVYEQKETKYLKSEVLFTKTWRCSCVICWYEIDDFWISMYFTVTCTPLNSIV